MPFSTHLTSAAIWAEIAYEDICGAGRVAPVVNVLLGMKTPAEGAEAEVHRLDLSLLFEGERVSRAELAPVRANPYAFTTTAAFPLSPRRLTFIGDRASGDVLSFKIEIVGLLRGPPDLRGRQLHPAGDPGRGVGVRDHRPRGAIVHCSPERQVSSVLSPISDSSFVTVEIEVPKGTDTAPFAAFWRTGRSPKLPPAITFVNTHARRCSTVVIVIVSLIAGD